jgi:hypothetical protein
MPPFTAIVVRRDSGNAEPAPVLAPSQYNDRPRELVAPQKAPDPIRYGDTPARAARMPIYAALAKRQWLAVMYDSQSGVIGKTEFMQYVSSPRGKALSWDERSNIQHEFPEAYGSHYILDPVGEDDALRLQMGV